MSEKLEKAQVFINSVILEKQTKEKKRDYSKMTAIMKSLGCEGEDGFYSSEDVNVDFDLRSVKDDEILSHIAYKFANDGYEASQADIRAAIGL